MHPRLNLSSWRRFSNSPLNFKAATARREKVDESMKSNYENSVLISEQTEIAAKDKQISNLPAKAEKLACAEILYRADPYEDIPGPKIFKNFSRIFKDITRNLTVSTLLWLLRRDPAQLFRIYGPVVRLPEILGGRILLINKPEHVSSVFRKNSKYPISSIFDSVERCRSQRLKEGGYYLEREWEEIKKTAWIPRIEDGEKRFEEFRKFGLTFVRKIRTSRNKRHETPENFSLEIDKWSLECFGQILFDKTFGFLEAEKMAWPSKQAKLLHFLSETTKNVCSCESGLQVWRFLATSDFESLEKSSSFVEKIISENVRQAWLNLMKKREALKGANTLVGNLSFVEEMLLRESTTPDDVTASIFDLLLLGTNALSSSLAFFLYYMAKHPRAQDKLFEEIKLAFPDKSRRLQRSSLDSLKYLGACLKETLRLRMPLPVVTTILSEDVALANFRIPRGTCVVAAAQVEALKEENFEEATRFRPERWSDEEVSRSLDRFPFDYPSVGRRAEEALRACIVHVIRNFRVEYNYGELKATRSAISHPDKPLVFTFIDRND